MLRYILTRLALTLPMLLVLLTVVFVILRVLPGDPCLALLGGRNVTLETLARCRAQLGLDRPLPVQYLDYLGDVARLDFGTSVRTGLPVTQELLLRLPATLELAVFGMLAATAIGVGTGLVAAVRRDRPADHLVRLFNIA
ncbi:MAG: ABC transporter permease, partial [Armatimonadota bacterium]|nr:ABC transporter permease [Armatimonadota bacterium]